MRIRHLRVNHLKNPMGYDFPYLLFSWEVTETASHFADQVQVLVSEREDMSKPVYDSGVRKNYRLCRMEVSFCLRPRTRYFWKVMVRTQTGEEAVSELQWFETAKREEMWKAEWIGAKEQENMPLLYRDLQIKESVKKARLYVFGAGLYEIEVNGKKAGEEYLLPGYHSYDLIMEYQTFDLTACFRIGENRLGILLGEGWYKGRFGFDDVYEDLYGNRKKCIAELYLEYESGKQEQIVTDESWSGVTSSIGKNNIYDGECQDLTLEPKPLTVEVLSDTKDLLTERSGPMIKKTERFMPISERWHKDGYFLLDFGESITGWVEFSGLLEKGQKIWLEYGEVLQEDGFYRDNLRTAKARFAYVSDGREETARPHFTYYGFRYVKVEGLKEAQKLRFIAYRLMSDIEETGKIETSDPMVNLLFQNTVRSQKCNFLDIPTDCPQRDERMGWTGDVNIFARTACFHMDSSVFFRHYARSLYLEQKLMKGAVPFFSPRPKVPVRENTNPFYLDGGACIWGDVAAMLPWILYQYYGDRQLLREQYPMMKLWVDYIRERAGNNPVEDL